MALKNIFNILVDLKIVRSINQPLVTQNDSVVFILEVMDNGVPFDLTDTTTISLAHTRKDGTVVVTPGTKVGNVATFELGTNETAVAGGVIAKAQFYGADGRVSTLSFGYQVGQDPTGSGYVPSEVEQTLIQVVMADAQAKIDELSAVDVVVLNQQLAEMDNEKASKLELANVLDGSPKGTYSTLAALQTAFPTGATGVYIVTADGHIYSWSGTAWADRGLYQAVGISDKAVTVEKTTFITPKKNLFDKTKITQDVVLTVTGTTSANTAYNTSDYMYVTPSTVYTRSHRYLLCFYDANKAFISYVAGAAPADTPEPITTPANARYIRASILKTYTDAYQLEKGSVATIYEPFAYVLEGVDEKLKTVELNLPSEIFALVGKEMNIYYENLILGDYKDYLFDVIATVGRQMKERFWYVPTVAGSSVVKINVYDKKTQIQVGTASTTIIVKSATVGTGVTKKALFIGDSTTFAGTYTGELLTLFGESDPMNLTLLGTQGTAPNLHEGRGGWKVAQYYSDPASPFVFSGAFDFTQYMTNNSYTDVDYVNFHLGINDVFGQSTDIGVTDLAQTMFTQLEAMIVSIHAFNPNIKIGIMTTIPPSYGQDSFGYDYLAGQTRWRYKRNWFILVNEYLKRFANRKGEGIYVVPLNVNLDTENNMVIASVAINSRNATLVPKMANGVHPATSGYLQMADTIYYWLKSFEV